MGYQKSLFYAEQRLNNYVKFWKRSKNEIVRDVT